MCIVYKTWYINFLQPREVTLQIFQSLLPAALHWLATGSEVTAERQTSQDKCSDAAPVPVSLFSQAGLTVSAQQDACGWRHAGLWVLSAAVWNRDVKTREVGRRKICRQPKWLSNARGNNRVTTVLIASSFIYKWIKTRAVLSWSRW